MEIRAGGLYRPEVVSLLRLHLAELAQLSPPESVHALDLAALTAPDISFWTAWENETLLGCAALKALGDREGEIKSMRTAPAHLRKGVASAVLEHIVATARTRGYRRLSLETGAGPGFEAAHAFYRRFGFADCGAFADYPAGDPFSRFMSLAL